MKVKKLLSKLVTTNQIEIQIYYNKPYSLTYYISELYTGYPFDSEKWEILNSKIEHYKIDFNYEYDRIIIKIKLKKGNNNVKRTKNN